MLVEAWKSGKEERHLAGDGEGRKIPAV